MNKSASVILSAIVIFTLVSIYVSSRPLNDSSDVVAELREEKLKWTERNKELESDVSEMLAEESTLKEEIARLTKEISDAKSNSVFDRVKPPATNASACNVVIPIVVIACNRPEYLEGTLDTLTKHRPSGFPIIVSLDCVQDRKAVQVAELVGKYDDVFLMKFDRKGYPDASSYVKIAHHYDWALKQVFGKLGYEQLVFVEDDLEVSPDFFDYMRCTLPILKADPSLYCVSAWNDNGKPTLVADPGALYRTDMFPGLGWMLLKSLWKEFDAWAPGGYWDDWLREPERRRGRSCIRPEIPRTKTVGKKGVSGGQFFDQHLKHISLYTGHEKFCENDLSYLHKDNYDDALDLKISQALLSTANEIKQGRHSGKIAKVTYSSRTQFQSVARAFGLMDDFKANVPRTAYRGVVEFKYNGDDVLIVPAAGYTPYSYSLDG